MTSPTKMKFLIESNAYVTILARTHTPNERDQIACIYEEEKT